MKKICRISLKMFTMVCVLVLLTGCWDALEIEKRNVLTTLIVDKKDGNYYYYTEIANLSRNNSSQSENQKKTGFSILIGEGKTFTEARDHYDLKSLNKVFLGGGRMLIFTDRMAKNGIEEYINRARGEIDYRKSILLATTSNDPMEILNNVPENAASVGFAIETNLKSSVASGALFDINIGDVLQVLAVKKAGFLVPDIKISKDKLAVSGYTVFNNDAKSIGIISADDRKGVGYILNSNAIFSYDIGQSNNKYGTKVILKSKKITPTYSEGQLTLNMDINFNANIDISKKMESMDQKTQEIIKSKLEEQTKTDVEHAVHVSQEFKCDYLGIYKYFRAVDPDKFVKTDWSDVYSKAKVNVSTHVNISQTQIVVMS